MARIRVETHISRNDLGRFFAGRQYDKTFARNFSGLTPNTVEECMDRVKNGIWLRPFAVFDGHDPIAWHYLHDMCAERDITWCSGNLVEGPLGPRGRDLPSHHLKAGLWAAARQHITEYEGFGHIFCYCMAVNCAGQEWIADCCGFTPVGLMREAVPEEGEMADIVVYCQREEDAQMCREEATRLFPEGRWDR